MHTNTAFASCLLLVTFGSIVGVALFRIDWYDKDNMNGENENNQDNMKNTLAVAGRGGSLHKRIMATCQKGEILQKAHIQNCKLASLREDPSGFFGILSQEWPSDEVIDIIFKNYDPGECRPDICCGIFLSIMVHFC